MLESSNANVLMHTRETPGEYKLYGYEFLTLGFTLLQ